MLSKVGVRDDGQPNMVAKEGRHSRNKVLRNVRNERVKISSQKAPTRVLLNGTLVQVKANHVEARGYLPRELFCCCSFRAPPTRG